MRVKIAANAHLGRLDEARAELGRVLAIDPLTIATEPPGSGENRRNPVVAARSGDGLLSKPSADTQPRPQERVLMPQGGPWPYRHHSRDFRFGPTLN